MPGLVGERNALCSRVTVLERGLLRLRDHFTLIRDRHRKLANETDHTQLQLVDRLDSGAAQVPSGPAEWVGFAAGGSRPTPKSLV